MPVHTHSPLMNMRSLQRALNVSARWSEQLVSKQWAAAFSSTTGPSDSTSYECGLQYGMVVDVSSASGPMDVIATPSSREDTLSIQAPAGYQVSAAADTPRVCVASAPQPQGAAAAPPGGPASMTHIHLPHRYCSLTANTAGGRFELRQMQEAALRVASGGGAVTVSKARCTDAHLDSSAPVQAYGGGGIQAGELSASQVVVRSGGGSIAIKRLFGLDVQLDSASGGVTLGALYGTKAVITTGGGPLALSHVSCSGLLSVDSEGGAVQVEGLEGAASLLSGGGPIQVHLHERFQEVFVDSAGGDVTVAISPGAAAALQVSARGGVSVDPALKLTGELSATQLEGWLQGPGPPPQSPAASVTTTTTSSSSSSSSSSPSSIKGGSRWVSAEELVMGPTPSTVDWQGKVAAALEPRAASATLNASRLARAAAGMAGADPTAAAAVADGGSSSTSSSSRGVPGAGLRGGGESTWPATTGGGGLGGGRLTVVAGDGRVRLVARSWMDAVRAAMGQQQQGRSAQQRR